MADTQAKTGWPDAQPEVGVIGCWHSEQYVSSRGPG